MTFGLIHLAAAFLSGVALALFGVALGLRWIDRFLVGVWR